MDLDLPFARQRGERGDEDGRDDNYGRDNRDHGSGGHGHLHHRVAVAPLTAIRCTFSSWSSSFTLATIAMP